MEITSRIRTALFSPIYTKTEGRAPIWELELELIQTQMPQKPTLRAEVYARALRASQNVKRAEVWVGARPLHTRTEGRAPM
jgi:hypothetical protein